MSENNQPKLKVCGLTQLPQIQELISLNIDFLGFIFYGKSPRFVLNYLTLEDISKINHQGKVGVFVNETVEKIVEISEKANLNYIQLHGDEDENFIQSLRQKLKKETKIIKVIKVGSQRSEVKNKIEKVFDSAQTDNHQPSTINHLLFDTDSKAFGGTGKTFDWQILNEIAISKPYFLSGGISLENNHQLSIINQQPFALDINSKFETEPGIKDLKKIKEFIQIIKVTK